jgi:hypothetical protein
MSWTEFLALACEGAATEVELIFRSRSKFYKVFDSSSMDFKYFGLLAVNGLHRESQAHSALYTIIHKLSNSRQTVPIYALLPTQLLSELQTTQLYFLDHR